MSPTFTILALVTLLSASAAMSLRNLVHSALSLVVTFAGLAGLYLQLHAEFVGFAQVLVYIGAVAILIVFAILLTRSGDTPNQAVLAPGWIAGIAVSAVVFAALGWAVLSSNAIVKGTPDAPTVAVKDIGDALMTKYVLPLEVIGLLLTAAMIGAVIIAMKEGVQNTKIEHGGSKMAKTSEPSATLYPPSSGREA